MSLERKNWGGECRAWWQSLQRARPNGKPNPKPDPGALARLRRASSVMEAAQEMQTIALYRSLHGTDFYDRQLEATAVVAAVLAHIRQDSDPDKAHWLNPAAERLGYGDPPPMSPLRMRRLTSARDAKETLRGFREAVALLKGRAPAADIAASIFDWLDELYADRRKTRWLYAYHGAGMADPTVSTRAQSSTRATVEP